MFCSERADMELIEDEIFEFEFLAKKSETSLFRDLEMSA
jgi:hypothetical protein